MKQIRTVDAVGHVLCHDITQIIPGKYKGPVFKKGHIVTKEDIPILLSVGKENLFVWEKTEGILHENEAAGILCDLAIGPNMSAGEPSEGKIELKAECDGLFKVNSKALRVINSTPQMMIATRAGDVPVKAGDKLAGTRIIPLVIEKEKMENLVKLAREAAGSTGILNLKPFIHRKVGIVTTGSEVYHGRIKDSFTPILKKKLEEYDTELVGHELSDDDDKMTTAAIFRLLDKGADLILCTGGMSVDPDDRTPLAIRNTGARIVTYGAPVLPGAMFLLSYLDGGERSGRQAEQTSDLQDEQTSGRQGEQTSDLQTEQTSGRQAEQTSDWQGEQEYTPVPVICGLPGCVMYAKRTIFDLLLARIMADDPICAEEIYALGEGGLCLGCETCTWPSCGFGKGRI